MGNRGQGAVCLDDDLMLGSVFEEGPLVRIYVRVEQDLIYGWLEPMLLASPSAFICSISFQAVGMSGTARRGE